MPDRGDYYWDDYLLAHLVKGSCLAYMNSPLQAEECFKFIVNNEKKIKEDNYLVPNALLELGLLLLRANDLEQSRIILEHAKYVGFPGYYYSMVDSVSIYDTYTRCIWILCFLFETLIFLFLSSV